MQATKAIHRLRIVGLVEGISFLLLVGIAMPLKYIWDMPLAVRVVGMAHGLLFILFCLFLVITMSLARWNPARGAMFFVAALVPFGPFLIDKRLKRYAEEAK